MRKRLQRMYAEKKLDPRPRMTNEKDEGVIQVVKLDCGASMWCFSSVTVGDLRFHGRCDKMCTVAELLWKPEQLTLRVDIGPDTMSDSDTNPTPF